MARRSSGRTYPRRPSTPPQRASVSRLPLDVRAILERAERSQDQADALMATPLRRLVVLPAGYVEVEQEVIGR